MRVWPRHRGDGGMVSAWTAVVAGACLLMVGLVVDGGVALRTRSSAFDLAGGAARVGAQQLDQQALADGRVLIDAQAAGTTAEAWLEARGTTGHVVVEDDTVTVTVREPVNLRILRPVQVVIEETATARARPGRQS